MTGPERPPAWAEWTASRPYTIGIEEEVMFLDPRGWGLAQRSEELLAALTPTLAPHAHAETHQATIELASLPHARAAEAAAESSRLRAMLAHEVAGHGIHVGSAGTHPSAVWSETQVSRTARYQAVHESMRALARREPTFALHVHVGVADPEDAMTLQNRLRAHVPLLLALSSNSPFWQGRDTGLASARTSIFQAFPRVGMPRVYASYGEWAAVVDQLLCADAFPAPTFIWWDVRLQPSLGTVEVRVMDAQTTAADTAALVALVQTIAHLELEEGFHSAELIHAEEILHENRFLASRDGMRARFIDPAAGRRIPATEALANVLDAAREHARELGTEAALDHAGQLSRHPGAERQRRLAEERGLDGMTRAIAGRFTDEGQ